MRIDENMNVILNDMEVEKIKNSDSTYYEDMQEILYNHHNEKLGDTIENYYGILCSNKEIEKELNSMLSVQKGDMERTW